MERYRKLLLQHAGRQNRIGVSERRSDARTYLRADRRKRRACIDRRAVRALGGGKQRRNFKIYQSGQAQYRSSAYERYKILQEEIPQLKDNSLLYDLVLYTIIEKMNTVQTVGNVLSYIRKNHVKEVHDVSIENGEIRIKCSV